MSELRITAGTLRGRRIPLPKEGVRATSERARQAFFNIIRDDLDGTRFLDLFAGSGAFAFEAVSRGAASGVCIDSSRRNIGAIERLAKEWNAPVRGVVADVFAALRHPPGFDIAYADPPYDFAHYPELLAALAAAGSGARWIAIEHRRRHDPFATEGALPRLRLAEYGEIWISFFQGTDRSYPPVS